MPTRAHLWLPAAIMLACSTPAIHQGATADRAANDTARAPEKPPLVTALEERYANNPRDLYLAYYLARLSAGSGDAELTLRWLSELAQKDWSLGVNRGDFAGVLHDPRVQARCDALQAAHERRTRSQLAFEISTPDFVAEGIAYDPASRRFFVGSINRHQIVAVSPEGEITPFAGHDSTRADDIGEVIGLRVDASRNLLWATGSRTDAASASSSGPRHRAYLLALDLATARPLRSVALDDDGSKRMLNDLCTFDDDTVYTTETLAGAVYRVAPGDTTASVLVEDGGLRFPNGIACDQARDQLYVADAMGIAIVDRGSGRSRRMSVQGDQPIAGIDGLYLHRDALIGVQNAFGAGRIVRIRLDQNGQQAVEVETLESGHPRMGIPTTGTLVDDALFFIANSRLECLGADDAAACTAPSVAIMSIQLKSDTVGARAREAQGQRSCMRPSCEPE